MTDRPSVPHLSDEMWPRATVFVVVVVAITLVSAVIIDVGGRDDNEHPFPIPAGVQRLELDTYLIHESSKASPKDICWGNGTSDPEPDLPAVVTVHRMDSERLYVRCSEQQRFGSHYPKRASLNFGQSLMVLFSSVGYWAFLIPFALGTLVPHFWLWRKWKRRRWEKDYDKRQAEARFNLEEQRLRELVAAYARYEISESEYDAGLERAYMAGVRKAE